MVAAWTSDHSFGCVSVAMHSCECRYHEKTRAKMHEHFRSRIPYSLFCFLYSRGSWTWAWLVRITGQLKVNLKSRAPRVSEILMYLKLSFKRKFWCCKWDLSWRWPLDVINCNYFAVLLRFIALKIWCFFFTKYLENDCNYPELQLF